MKYRVYLEQDEDGVFVAICPALPGSVSQGRKRSEATANIREDIEGHLKRDARNRSFQSQLSLRRLY
ncbi:MAG TPA: type II toxin-antitoxin system HicB family antitoxin [Bryobacteraceae bacterium]|nr:type II toxin-antitoxin system HicB family antitoxin [Bryobacteraceae bacterium]